MTRIRVALALVCTLSMASVASATPQAFALPGDHIKYAMSGHEFMPMKPHPEEGIKMTAWYGYHGLEPFDNETRKFRDKGQDFRVLKDKLDDFAVAPTPTTGVHGPAVDDVLSALINLGYQRPAAEKAIEQAVAKDKALTADFDGLFRGALKLIR